MGRASALLALLALLLLSAQPALSQQKAAEGAAAALRGRRMGGWRQLRQEPLPQGAPAQPPAAAAAAANEAPVGCNNPANPPCGECEACQADGTCAPRTGSCGAGPAKAWAGQCQAGVCVATGCNNPANPQCDSQCQTCQANGLCAAKPGDCRAGPAMLWAGTCAAGACVASGCNNPTLAAARCDAQCEACQPDGSCAPKAPTTDCLANGLQGKCSAGQCKALPSPPSPPPPASQPPPQSPPPKASPPPQSPPPQSPPPKAQPPPQAPAQPPAQPPAPQEPAKTAAKPTAAAVQQPVQEPQPATGEQPAEAAANADAAGVAAAAAAAEEATVEGFVPFDFGVTATAGAGAQYVVLTWAAGASWADQVLGYRLDIQQEGATPGQFVPAAGWERALVQTRLTPAYPALPPALKERTATTPAGTTTHYRLTVRIEEPTPGARVRVALQSVLGDGGQLSVPAVLTSAA